MDGCREDGRLVEFGTGFLEGRIEDGDLVGLLDGFVSRFTSGERVGDLVGFFTAPDRFVTLLDRTELFAPVVRSPSFENFKWKPTCIPLLSFCTRDILFSFKCI